MTGGTTEMRITPSEAYDPIDIASLCLWQREQSGDNRDRIQRLLSNLPLAGRHERRRHCQRTGREQVHRVPFPEPQHGAVV